MRYASVCSGRLPERRAWQPLDWTPAWCSEIDPFCCALLAHHHADVPNLGDMTKITDEQIEEHGPIDLLVGGTPCQSFSVAGLRAGMADPRGNLALVFLGLVDRARPRWVVWENVPGVLSSNEGRDFGAFLGALGELGYGWAYRVLDAQYVRVDGFERAVPQRRRRVFVVGHLGDWRRAAAVLFERSCLSWDPPPRRQAGKGVARSLTERSRSGGRQLESQDEVAYALRNGTNEGYDKQYVAYGGNNPGERAVSTALNAKGGAGRMDFETETFVAGPLMGSGAGTERPAGMPWEADYCVAHSLRPEGFDASEDGTGRGTPIVAFDCKQDGRDGGEVAPTMRALAHDKSHANAGGQLAVAFDTTQVTSKGNYSNPKPGGPCHPLAGTAHPPAVVLDTEYEPAHNGLQQEGAHNADEEEAGRSEALSALREAHGEEALSRWGLGVLAGLLPPEVLRQALHGGGLRCPPKPKHGLVNVALSRPEGGSTWTLRDVWRCGRDGRRPQGWQPSEQLTRELAAYLSELSRQKAPAQAFLQDMWRAAQGLGVLREALSALQEVGRPIDGEGQPIRASQEGGRTEPNAGLRGAGLPSTTSHQRVLRDAQSTGTARNAVARKEVPGSMAVRRLTPV